MLESTEASAFSSKLRSATMLAIVRSIEMVPAGSRVVSASVESLQAVTDPVAAEFEAALEMRRTGADAKALPRALRRIECEISQHRDHRNRGIVITETAAS